MTTKNTKNGSNMTIVTDNTESKRTAKSKFTGEPQNKEASSGSGQAYFNVDDSPFAIVKHEGAYRIVLGSDIISKRKFLGVQAAKNFIKNGKWELIWATCMWVMMHAEEIKARIASNEKETK